MKREAIYERVLRRLLREASPDLGNVEFSPDRKDPALRNEPNTPEEDALYNDLRDWVVSVKASPTLPETIKTLMSHPKYSRFFREPGRIENLYRGVLLTDEDMIGILGSLPSVPEGGKALKFTVDLRNPVASWTRSPDIAYNFAAGNGSDGKTWSVILNARAGDNPGVFLDLHGILTQLNGWADYLSEEEVLATDTVTARGLKWYSLV